MTQSETRIENRFFLNPLRTPSLVERLMNEDWKISRQQPLDTLYICVESANGVSWNPSVRARARQPIGPDLFCNIPGEFMLKNMLTGEKELVIAPFLALQQLQSYPDLTALVGPYLRNKSLAATQFSLYSDRTHYVPPACFNERGHVTSFYPRITIDSNYTLNLFESGEHVDSLAFNWAKVEAKALDPDNLSRLGALLTEASARKIETGFIVDQIDMLLAERNIKISLA